MTEQAVATVVHINPDNTSVEGIPADAIIGNQVFLIEFTDDMYDEVVSGPGGPFAVGVPFRSHTPIEFGARVWIGDETTVGPSTLGSDVVVGAQCVIEGVVGDNSVIGDRSRIFGSVDSNSVIGVDVTIHEDAYLPVGAIIPDGSLVVPASEVQFLPEEIANSELLIVIADLQDQVE